MGLGGNGIEKLAAAIQRRLERTAAPIAAPVADPAAKMASTAIRISPAARQALEQAAGRIGPGEVRLSTRPPLTAVERRAEKLLGTQVAAVVPSNPDRLLAAARSGTLRPARSVRLDIGNVTQHIQENGGYAAFVLTDQGKRAVAGARGAEYLDASIDQGLAGVPGIKNAKKNLLVEGLRFGAEDHLPVPLDLRRDVAYVLVDAEQHPDLMTRYEAAVRRGEAPATIAGKPYAAFFRPSEDFHNDLEVAAFGREVPGFSQRPLDEQRSVAALASRVMNTFPPEVPAGIRRRVATSLVTYLPVHGRPGAAADAVGELRRFFHGTRAGKAIAERGLKIGTDAKYGRGVYFSNPTTSAGFAFRSDAAYHTDLSLPAQMVSGQVDLGEVTVGRAGLGSADTRFIPRRRLRYDDTGDYWVTKSPRRFHIQALTLYEPNRTEGLEAVRPDLLEAARVAPAWAKRYLDRM